MWPGLTIANPAFLHFLEVEIKPGDVTGL